MEPLKILPSLGSTPTDILRAHILPRIPGSAPQLSLVNQRFNQVAMAQLCDRPITRREIEDFIKRLLTRPVRRQILGAIREEKRDTYFKWNTYQPILGVGNRLFINPHWPTIVYNTGRNDFTIGSGGRARPFNRADLRNILLEEPSPELDLRSQFDIFSHRMGCIRTDPSYPYKETLKVLQGKIRNTPFTYYSQKKLQYYLLLNLGVLKGDIQPWNIQTRTLSIFQATVAEIREIWEENQELAIKIRQLILQL